MNGFRTMLLVLLLIAGGIYAGEVVNAKLEYLKDNNKCTLKIFDKKLELAGKPPTYNSDTCAVLVETDDFYRDLQFCALSYYDLIDDGTYSSKNQSCGVHALGSDIVFIITTPKPHAFCRYVCLTK